MQRPSKNLIVSLLLSASGIFLVFIANPFSEKFSQLGLPFAESVGYGLEHLGVVLVVGMILRATLEAASQKEFFKILSFNLGNQIETYLRPLENSVQPIQTGLLQVKEQLQPLQDSIKTLADRLTYKITRILGDERLRKELEQTVLNPNFIRPYYNLTLKLEPLSSHTDFLKVFILVEYEVKNVSDVEAEYPIVSWLDDVIKLKEDPGDNKPGFKRLEFGGPKVDDRKPRTLSLNIEDLEKLKEISRKEGVISVRSSTYLIKPADIWYVEIDGMQIMRMEDHFVWNLITLTEKFSISIELLGGLTFEQLEVYPREMHHIGHEEFLQPLTPQTRTVWNLKIEEVILPYQGIEIRWAPKCAQSAGSPSDRPEATAG